MKIQQILDKIDDNQLFVPAFQREYVWKRDNAKELIASLIRQYPTGTLLTWETNRPPELKGSWEYDARQGAVKLILDGQQRITTLYLLIRDQIPPYYKASEIIQDPRGLYVNLQNLDLQYYKKTQMANDPYWVNVTDIFQRKIRDRDVLRQLSEKGVGLTPGDEDRIYDNFRALEDIPMLEFLEQSIPIRASLKEAIDIFYVVNDSGINLTEAELALAQVSGYWPQAREEFKKKLEALKEDGFNFKLDFIMYCLLGVLYAMGSDLRRLHDESNDERIRKAWKELDEYILDYVVNILRTQAYVDHSNEVNSVYALVPIVAFVYRKGRSGLSQEEIRKIIKWFYYSQIRQRYISQLPQKLDKDVGIAMRSDHPFDELLNIIRAERPLEITPEEFIGVDIRNALYSLMRWYFKSRGAICFTTGVGIRRNMGKKYLLEWDHIFPYSVLKEHGYNVNNRHKYALAQEITNRAVLTQIANRRKSNKLAKDYLHDVKARFPSALPLQVIPENEELWELDRYEDFLQARRVMLAEQLNVFLDGLTVTDDYAGAVSIEELIAEGESSELEFKSSLRWNYQLEQADKKLETVILKTIAAFSNADGGTLIIGVGDNKEVLGLGHDYRLLGGSRDEFELHLRNLLNDAFGKVFTASTIKVAFHEISGEDICKVDIPRGIKAVYLQVAGKDGQKEEKFYVRSGNSSQELSVRDASDYARSRF